MLAKEVDSAIGIPSGHPSNSPALQIPSGRSFTHGFRSTPSTLKPIAKQVALLAGEPLPHMKFRIAPSPSVFVGSCWFFHAGYIPSACLLNPNDF